MYTRRRNLHLSNLWFKKKKQPSKYWYTSQFSQVRRESYIPLFIFCKLNQLTIFSSPFRLKRILFTFFFKVVKFYFMWFLPQFFFFFLSPLSLMYHLKPEFPYCLSGWSDHWCKWGCSSLLQVLCYCQLLPSC